MIIKIKNLRLKTIVGIYKWEEKIDREIIINAEIETDHENSLVSDDINDTIDYDKLVSQIKLLISQKRFKLIEKMAQDVMDLILSNKKIKRCKLEIDKLNAVEALESFSITLIQGN